MANTEQQRCNSQALRKNLTKEERHLWYDFLKTYPVPVKRQFVIGGYIVDFYCHQARLVIELDGSQHCTPKNVQYDMKRTNYLESQGLYVLRLSNLDVTRQFSAVCEAVDLAIRDRIARPKAARHPSSAPSGGTFPPGEGSCAR